MDNIVKAYATERAAFIDKQVSHFLKKNLIEFTTIEDTNKRLRDKGYRLIDEVQNDSYMNQTHTLLLVKIVDQHQYTLKAPTIEGGL